MVWVDGNFNPGTRFTDPDYYGHWQYGGHGCSHNINSLPADPDFFQIINYATNEAIGVNDPNRIRNTFNIGAALIDLYDGDDLDDPDPNNPGRHWQHDYDHRLWRCKLRLRDRSHVIRRS